MLFTDEQIERVILGRWDQITCLTLQATQIRTQLLNVSISVAILGGETMRWISVTFASGKASLVDFSKVMFVIEVGDGCRLHFDHITVDQKGKMHHLALTSRNR